MCAVSYREVNEVARRIDADITVVSLEPTSIEGILNTITTVGAMAEVEDAAIDVVEALRERLGAIEQRVAARREAGHRAPRVVGLEWLDPPFAVGHWVPEQIRRAGGWDLLGSDGEKAHPTTWDAVAEVDPEMLFLMPCGFHLSETVREWARTPIPPWLAELPAVQRGAVFARRWLGVLLAAGSAGHRWDRAARRDHGSGRVRGHRAARRLDPGPGRLTLPFRASFSCLWCGTAHTVRSPDDLEGWAQLCPDCVGKAGDNGFLRFRLRQALTERSAAARTRRRRGPTEAAEAAEAAQAAGARPRTAARARSPRRRPRRRAVDDRLLRGARSGVRRLVPAPRPLCARRDPRRRLERRARQRRSMAGRAAVERRDRRARGRDGLVVAVAGVARRAVPVRRVAGGPRSGARAAGGARPARPPARARRVGRARTGPWTGCSSASGSATSRASGSTSSWPSRAAGSSRMGGSRPSIPCPTPRPAPPTIPNPPTTSPPAAWPTAASSRS